MLFDGIKLVEGSELQNLTVQTGTAFPTTPTEGEVFYRTDAGALGLYVYDGTQWSHVADADSLLSVLGYTPVNKAGDTMTGQLVLSGTPTTALAAATKQYVDNSVPTFSTLAGKPTTLSGYGITDAQPLSADLTSIAALSTTGLIARTGTGTEATRAISGGAGRIAVTNGDGVAGAPVIDLASGIISAPGTFKSVTVDTYGRVTAGTNPTTLAGFGITDAAPLDSPALTGSPTAPTPVTGTNSTQIATTAFVLSELGTLTTSVIPEGSNLYFTTARAQAAISLTAGTSGATYTGGTLDLSAVAPLASPAFTGTPTAPTATAGTNTTQIATTAFVLSSVTSGTAAAAVKWQTARSLSLTGDATATLAGVDGTADVSAALTLATVNAAPVSNSFVKVTTTGKGLVTATSAVGNGDITAALGYVPVNKAGDTLTGALLLAADPTTALGAATKQYVDNVAAGLNAHGAVVTSTTSALTATYANGTSGVGATLTATANGALVNIGGYSTLNVNDRVLVKDQTDLTQNGIYTVTSLGSSTAPWVLTRAADFDNSPQGEIVAGAFTFIQNGTLAGSQWVQTTPGVITVGTSNIAFTQLSGPGVYSAGTGLSLTNNTFANTGVLTVTAGTGVSVNGATGNVTITNTGVTAVSGTAGQIVVSASTGSVALSLAADVTGLNSVTATTFNGALNGNASTASKLATARAIALTGDATASVSFDGSVDVSSALTLATVNGNVGAFGSSTAIPTITVNAKGLVTAVSTAPVVAPAGTLTGTALAPNVTASSLTSVGTLTSLNVAGNATVGGNVLRSVASIAAAGTTQATATQAATDVVVVSGTGGIILPVGVAGMEVVVINPTAGAISVYPASGAAVDALGANNAFSLAAGARIMFICTAGTQWYTLNATYA